MSGWPSPGEVGIIAEFEDDLVGAGWLRFFTSDDPGFGYVADDVPELSLAVVEAWRGRGIGRDLLRELIGLSSKSGIGRISLSVERDNFARSLYLEHGFEIVRHEVDADTMILNP